MSKLEKTKNIAVRDLFHSRNYYSMKFYLSQIKTLISIKLVGWTGNSAYLIQIIFFYRLSFLNNNALSAFQDIILQLFIVFCIHQLAQIHANIDTILRSGKNFRDQTLHIFFSSKFSSG